MARPQPNEYAPYFARYIDLVTSENVLATLQAQTAELMPFWRSITEEQANHSYGEGKWTLKQALHHMADTERIFAYRALWFARGAASELPGFEQDDFALAAQAGVEKRKWANIVDEFVSVRGATLTLFESFTDEEWERMGVASGNGLSARAAAYALTGHELYHLKLTKERYLA